MESVAPMVDPFLVEALQNPRHRLTILRMELDVQKFLQNQDQQQFEFPHFPTSYLRLAAHRVAQHYGLLTLVQDTSVDGSGTKILVKKMAESRYPAVCLSEIPVKQSEQEKSEQIKIVLKPRPASASANGANEMGNKCSPTRTVEEREEEYERARARIFSSASSFVSEDSSCVSGDENEVFFDWEKFTSARDGASSSRVAILRDREKDLTDPDYDRSYQRYARNMPANQNFSLAPFNMQKVQLPFVQYDPVFHQASQVPRFQATPVHTTPVMNPYCATGFNQMSRDAVYMHWPTSAMMYAQSYDQVRRAGFQAPYCQQPLSFGYSQSQ